MISLRHIVWHLGRTYAGVDDSKLSARALAEAIGKAGKVMEQKLGLHDQAHIPNVNDVDLIAECHPKGHQAFAEYFCAKANMVAVNLPDDADCGDMNLLDLNLAVTVAVGDLAYSFQKSWSDNRLDQREYNDYEKLTHIAIARHLANLAKMKQLVR